MRKRDRQAQADRKSDRTHLLICPSSMWEHREKSTAIHKMGAIVSRHSPASIIPHMGSPEPAHLLSY